MKSTASSAPQKNTAGSVSEHTDAQSFQRLLRANVFLPVFLILILCGVYLVQVIYLLRVNQSISRSDQIVTEITEVQKLMLDAETGIRGFLLTHDELFLEPYSIAMRQLPDAISHLKEMVANDSEQSMLLERAHATFGAWKTLAEERFALEREHNKLSASQSAGAKRLMDSIRGLILTMLSAEQKVRNERAHSAETSTRVVLVLTFLGGALVALLLAYLGRRQLFVLAGSYRKSLEQQRSQNIALEHQAWLRTGQSELLAYLRGDLNEEQVAHRILIFLSKYVKADVSAIYGDSNSGNRFDKLAAIGTDGNDLASRISIKKGESFLGKAAEMQEVQLISDLPAGYLNFSSSLGSTPVKHLLVAPFTARNETVAVLEIAFFHEPENVSRIKELLELLVDPVGTILQATYMRSRQKTLFEETQQLNEELQAQQEELRVSNEELEQQTSALKESQARMEVQQVELEESNQKLSTQTALLEDKARELSTASRYKSEFLANMSHELRTPLNSSLILAKLLADNTAGNLTKEQVEFAETIYSAGNDLLTLINDILDLAKVEAGRLEVHPETIYLQTLGDSLRKTFKPLAEKKNLKLDIHINPDAPAMIESDRTRIEQILKNLLSNALKFTEAGSVRLDMNSKSGFVQFSVTDTGIGIPKHQQQNIFEAFRQADGTTNRKYGGTGLGLSISRELALLLGGSISVQSRPGEGSCFELSVPMKLVVNRTAAPTAQKPTKDFTPPEATIEKDPVETLNRGDDRLKFDKSRRTVLIVEDEPAFAKALCQLAHELGFQCLIAHSAQEGMDLAKKFLPSAVILDVALPDQTGMAVLDQLKDDLKTRHIPVHMISAHDYSHAAMEMGAVGYTLKPVKREELMKAFQLLEQKFSQTLKRVLIVEDDPTQRKSIDSLISSSGVKAIHAERGEQALILLRESKFDCVILDLSLPDMSGFDLLERMSSMHNASFPPVIVYTGRDLSREEEDQLRRHSNSIIVKGARSPERLLDEISLFLHQVETELPVEKRKMIQSLKNRDKLLEGKTILLVDDDARNLFALMHVLEPRGAKVEVARNGREALEALKKLSHVDLVLMDIMMPEMDGYEAIREIRKNPETAQLPVIAVTAKAMSTDYEKCLAAGANDYLAKPLDINRLLSLLKVWIQRGRKD